jgi:hypothetical protein
VKTFEQFIEEKSYKRSENYMGNDHYGYVSIVGQHRDSEIIEQSNFAAALDRLGGENDESVVVARCGHWAVGWVETLYVKIDSDKIQEAYKIFSELENYPVLDDQDLSDREFEDSMETADFCLEEFMGDFKISKRYKKTALATLQDHIMSMRSWCGEAFYSEEEFYDRLNDGYHNSEGLEEFWKIVGTAKPKLKLMSA